MKRMVVFLVAVFLVFNVYAQKRVLFDNAHAQTAGSAHWTIETGYSDFADDLTGAGFEVNAIEYAVTYDVLKKYDIFVVPEPNNPFSETEIKAITKFVSEGGGLFLIADHKGADRNRNGWDAVKIYNKFVDNFGFKFDAETYSIHPIMGKRLDCSLMENVKTVGTWGGTTLSVTDSKNAVGLIHLSSSKGGNPYIVAAIHGKGRVIAVGDSSPFDDGTMSNGKASRKLYNNYNQEGYHHRIMSVNFAKYLAGEIGEDLEIVKNK
ncbi:MAG: GldG family protein [Candidatus Muirbacterium halophilum]|nr:GldG family protein [Candidatus Muirbacterium halophilum]